ncbi:YHS domain-containing (seleno)protein [Bosea sp. BK604]|uniref:YHS domain-containing (seleno)protein n=1 Tax=Bosea sp. BK604 TaxID=2512180 RepID=UPI00104B6288|nr:YHS domain-containing (seleno)protein [Bosea sp. BK604]TCR66417.1 YHS domain-containing protein [Bosea sp. BK604]
MFDRRSFMLLAGAGAVTTVLATAAARADTPRPVNTLGSRDTVAIRGYDPVAYFREGGPRPGKPEFSISHAGATWRFASAENKALFEADPERYLPAYGGFCAYGTSRGYLVKIEPEAWSIVDGRLYLNYDLDVRRTWLGDTRKYIARAEGNWPRLGSADIR